MTTLRARERLSRADFRDLSLALPTALAALLVAGLAWREQGSILVEHFLPYALLLGLLVAVVVAVGVGKAPSRAALLALAGLTGLAAWTAASALWAPLPALARDEALLVATYALAFALPLVTLRSAEGRSAAADSVVAVCAGLALAGAFALAFGGAPDDRYEFGRLASPIGYVNAQAAGFLVAFWPAVALAAQRTSHIALRALAAGAGTCLLAGGLLTQSKGGAVALAVSATAVFALSAARLRILLPALVSFALVALSYDRLTEPFRRRGDGEALADAAREAGARVLVLAVLGLALGAAYAAVDERVELSARARRAAGRLAAAALVAGIVAGAAVFLVRVDNPGDWAEDRWHDFKTVPEREEGSSHLVNLGSNRYDFWRVALDEFRDHPVAGIGARGWDVAYLQHGRSDETPRRAHSLELDVASEEGVVGLSLLTLALLPSLLALARRARIDVLGAGLFAAAAYWLVHAAGDWIWTFPAVGLPFFLLLGTGLSQDYARPLRSRLAVPAAAGVALITFAAFTPPWLSARITTDVVEQPTANPHADLEWARRLDPLSVEPLLAEAELARTPAGAVRPLERAAGREPRSAGVRYLLGVAYLEAGRPRDAVSELEAARALSPRDERIAKALRQARRSTGPG